MGETIGRVYRYSLLALLERLLLERVHIVLVHIQIDYLIEAVHSRHDDVNVRERLLRHLEEDDSGQVARRQQHRGECRYEEDCGHTDLVREGFLHLCLDHALQDGDERVAATWLEVICICFVLYSARCDDGLCTFDPLKVISVKSCLSLARCFHLSDVVSHERKSYLL